MDQTTYVYEGTQANFATLVLENSRKGPVLVNFWAEWAGPCHRLFPLLARLAEEYGGKFLLVNLNTDEQKPIAEEYGVKSLPMVKIFRQGKVEEEFHGYQPEPELRRIINRHVVLESDQRITEALRQYKSGDVESGLSRLAEAALDDPENLRIPVMLGKLLMAQGRFEEAGNLLRGLPTEMREQPEVGYLLAHLGFIQLARTAPAQGVLEDRLTADPDDAEARHGLAALALVNDDYEAALEYLLELMRRDRSYGEDAGRRGMLAVFSLLGDEGELVDRYRMQMFKALH